jgi:hypothetical protein
VFIFTADAFEFSSVFVAEFSVGRESADIDPNAVNVVGRKTLS